MNRRKFLSTLIAVLLAQSAQPQKKPPKPPPPPSPGPGTNTIKFDLKGVRW
jgi:hypothetical protein